LRLFLLYEKDIDLVCPLIKEIDKYSKKAKKC